MADKRVVSKKIKGGLKMAVAFAPMVLTCACGSACIGAITTTIVKSCKLDDYKETSVYVQEVQNDLQKYQQQLEDGDITNSEYIEKIDNMAESSYYTDVIKRDIEGNEQWQEILKSFNCCGIATISLLGATTVVGITWLILGSALTDTLGDLKYSARRDLRWEPPKPKVEIYAKIEKPEKIENNVDLSSEEEKLGSLDDFLNSLQ